MGNAEIRVSPAHVFKGLLAVICLLTLLSLTSAFFRLYLKNSLHGAVWLFEVSGDANIPTWYASVTLLFCALLLLIIGWLRFQEKERHAKYWLSLSGIFVWLSIDEVAMLHEWSGDLFTVPAARGFLSYGWVVVAIPLVALIGLYYRRFLQSLPVRTRNLFLLAAFVFVGGALGIEMVNARLDYTVGYESLAYTLSTAVEEFCEMLGVAIFIYALLSYLERWVDYPALTVSFASNKCRKY
ncbi:MAG: hypothetical protein WBD47_02430 [Phormidesmis sp.]